MAGDDREQHGEVRQRRSAAAWVAAIAVVVLVGLVVWAGQEDAPSQAMPPTSTTAVPTTRPGPLPVLHVVADTDAGPRPATTASAPDAAADGTPFEALQATPVVTDGQVALLVDGGAVLVGRPGGAFAAIDLGVPSSALVASNEPGHVWVRLPGDELALVDLDGTDPPVRIALDGDRVLGPATFGVVTVSDAGVVSWRRPSFDATAVAVPPGRTPLDAGGGSVLVERPQGGGGERVFEVFTVDEGALVGGFRGAVGSARCARTRRRHRGAAQCRRLGHPRRPLPRGARCAARRCGRAGVGGRGPVGGPVRRGRVALRRDHAVAAVAAAGAGGAVALVI